MVSGISPNQAVQISAMMIGTSVSLKTNETAVFIQFNEAPIEIIFSKEQVQLIIDQFTALLPEVTYSTEVEESISYNAGDGIQ